MQQMLLNSFRTPENVSNTEKGRRRSTYKMQTFKVEMGIEQYTRDHYINQGREALENVTKEMET